MKVVVGGEGLLVEATKHRLSRETKSMTTVQRAIERPSLRSAWTN